MRQNRVCSKIESQKDEVELIKMRYKWKWKCGSDMEAKLAFKQKESDNKDG
jgi:hypothetical protein